jgi:hypothetical protein
LIKSNSSSIRPPTADRKNNKLVTKDHLQKKRLLVRRQYSHLLGPVVHVGSRFTLPHYNKFKVELSLHEMIDIVGNGIMLAD